jgi:hypothetical protein
VSALRIGPGLTLPLDAVTRAWAIVGQRGTGKTSTAVVVVEEAVKAGAQVAVIDPTGAWYGLRTSASGKAAGLPVVVFGGHNGDLPLDHTAGAFLARLVIEQHLNVVLDLERMTKGQQVQFVAEFAETLYHENRTALTLVMDEAHRFAPQQLREPGGYGARCLGAVTDVVTLGRRKGLGAVLISQRPAKINKDVFEQAEVMVVHRLLGPNDRKAIAGWLDEVAGEGIDVLNREVPRLAPQTALMYAPHYDIAQVLAVRAKRTFDSSATPEVGAAAVVPKGRADVDLEAIRTAMAETIERIEQDDPVKLRARINELERARDGHKGWEQDHAETITRLEREVAEARASVREVVPPEVTRMREQIGEQVERMRKGLDLIAELLLGVELMESPDPKDLPPPRPIRLVRAEPMERQVMERGVMTGELKLKAGARRMVEVMARMHPMKLTRSQVAALAGLRRTSGTFSQYLGAIRQGGYAVEQDGKLELTEMGFALVGGVPRAPQTVDETREMWRSKMKAGARRMLDILIDEHPEWMTRFELAGKAGITPSSGTFSQYLGTLRQAGLLEESSGSVRASDVLFLSNGRR